MENGRYVSDGPIEAGEALHSNGSGVPSDVKAIMAVNILEREYLQSILELQDLIATSADTAGTTLDDICARPTSTSCAIESPLNWFRSDAAAL